jgi:hypothetical protein
MREYEIQKAVLQHWKALGKEGTLVAAIPNQNSHGQYGLTAGLADLLILAPGLPVGFLEIKTDKGKPSKAQLEFIDKCKALGIPAAITRGRDEPIRILEEWNVVARVK